MPDIILQLSILFALLIANGVFALAEMAIVSARRSRLQQMADRGSIGATAALRLADSPDTFLPSVQIGVTGVGVAAGAIGGAQLGDPLAETLVSLGMPLHTAGPVAFGAVVVFITFLSLVIGELIPKRIALLYPERCAAFLSIPLQLFSSLFFVLVKVLNGATEFVLKFLPLPRPSEPTVSEEEIKIIVDQAAESGAVEETEGDLVKKVLRLDDMRMSDLMTPRRDMFWVNLQAPWSESWKAIVASGHSHIPVAERSVDSLLGMLSLKDALKASVNENTSPEVIRGLLRKTHIVPENLTALDLVEQFRTQGTHIAVVVDEHGGIEGLVTLHDLVGALVGVVPSSPDAHEPLVVQRDDGSFLLDPSIHVDELREKLSIEAPRSEDEQQQTLRALIFNQLKGVPREGKSFRWQGYHFEIVDMDGRRIDKVLATREPTPPLPGSPKSAMR